MSAPEPRFSVMNLELHATYAGGAGPPQNERQMFPVIVISGLNRTPEECVMIQKVIEVVGISSESFARAAANAVAEAAKTIHGMKWARVAEFEMHIDDKRITEYRATTRIYFDVEH
jgi:dodecin